MRVFLTGASGFVGSHILRRLLCEGHTVRALVRRRGSLHGQAELEEVEGDINSGNLSTFVAGCDAVINLVGIIYERGMKTFESVHHHGTRNLVAAARQNGVTRFVQISALRARPTDATEYHTTKFAAEEEVRNSGIPFVVLRPSLIFGPPFLRPIPGTGKYRFRPIHVDDVTECFSQSLSNPAAAKQTIDLVGSEELNLDEIGNVIAESLGIQKKVLHIPMPFMKAAATFFSLLPVTPPVTALQLRMMKEGSTADPTTMKRIFGIEPIGFRAGARRYLTAEFR